MDELENNEAIQKILKEPLRIKENMKNRRDLYNLFLRMMKEKKYIIAEKIIEIDMFYMYSSEENEYYRIIMSSFIEISLFNNIYILDKYYLKYKKTVDEYVSIDDPMKNMMEWTDYSVRGAVQKVIRLDMVDTLKYLYETFPTIKHYKDFKLTAACNSLAPKCLLYLEKNLYTSEEIKKELFNGIGEKHFCFNYICHNRMRREDPKCESILKFMKEYIDVYDIVNMKIITIFSFGINNIVDTCNKYTFSTEEYVESFIELCKLCNLDIAKWIYENMMNPQYIKVEKKEKMITEQTRLNMINRGFVCSNRTIRKWLTSIGEIYKSTSSCAFYLACQINDLEEALWLRENYKVNLDIFYSDKAFNIACEYKYKKIIIYFCQIFPDRYSYQMIGDFMVGEIKK